MLGLLSFRERSGYDLKQTAEAGIGYVWRAAKTQVYAVLPRLVAGGYATSRKVVQERLPDKSVYEITDRGLEVLREWLEEPVDDPDPTRSAFLLKVFLGRLMSPDALIAHVQQRRDESEEAVRTYLEIEEEIRDSPINRYGYVTLRWGMRHQQAWIEWCDEILAELGAAK